MGKKNQELSKTDIKKKAVKKVSISSTDIQGHPGVEMFLNNVILKNKPLLDKFNKETSKK